MADFSIQDVAFTGFGVVRRHPKALVAWWLYALVFSLAFGAVLVTLAGSDAEKLLPFSGQQSADPYRALDLLDRHASAYVALLVLSLISQALLGAAMIRAVLRPQDDRFGYLRLGADELRQLGLVFLTFLVFMAAYFGVAIAIGLVVGVIVAMTRAGPTVLLVVLFLSEAVIMLVLAVRFSLAPALTFQTHRINLFGSLGLTRRRFWRLFGAYLLAFSLAAVVYLLSVLLIFALGAILAGGDPAAALKTTDMAPLKVLLSPPRLLQTVLGAGVWALVWPVLFAPAAAIYQALTPASAALDTFA
jgi:hypothetical protein